MKKRFIVFFILFGGIYFKGWGQSCASQINYYNTGFPQLHSFLPSMISGIPYNEFTSFAIPTNMNNSQLQGCSFKVLELKLDTAASTNGIIPSGYNASWEFYDEYGQQKYVGDTVNMNVQRPYRFFCARLKNIDPPVTFIENYRIVYKVTFLILNQAMCLPGAATDTIPILFSVDLCNPSLYSCTPPYTLQGHVYNDVNVNCSIDAGETLGSAFTLKIKNTSTNEETFHTTYPDGFYKISLPQGNYEISTLNNSLVIGNPPCFGTSTSVAIDPSMAQTVNFPIEYTSSCAWVQVDMATSEQIRCASNSNYVIEYKNIGNLPVTSGDLKVTLPPAIVAKSFSTAPATILGATYFFNVINLQPGEVRRFWLTDSIDCNAPGGITVCPKVEFIPHNTVCNQPSAQWDGANVEVDGSCELPQVRFVIKNSGQSMATSSQYRVYQNGFLFVPPTTFQLSAGDSLVLTYPISGATFHLEADQVPNHPRQSLPRYFVEACGPGPDFTLGHVATVQQDDLEDDTEICCEVTLASYDPNDKRVTPVGEGDIHAIGRRDVLEYIIRFQNTGTGPAYLVKVEDKLDLDKLDINTLVLGATSHDYVFELSGNGKAIWIFPQIVLPDSASDPVGSIGFLKFKIKQKGLLPWGTEIRNKAEIYFDTNPAIITNTTLNTVDSLFKHNTSIAEFANERLIMYPNPTTGSVNIEIGDVDFEGKPLLRAIGLNGQILLERFVTEDKIIQLDCSAFTPGIYFIQVIDSGNRMYTGKLLKN